jgi:hypothetical protein
MAADIILDECAACHCVLDIDDLVQCEDCQQVFCRDCQPDHTCIEDANGDAQAESN